jgi:hypothetical protein
MRCASRKGGQHVAEGGCLQRGDDADAMREARQRLPAFRRKQSFRLQLGAQTGECLEQCANAGMSQGFYVELKAPTRFI